MDDYAAQNPHGFGLDVLVREIREEAAHQIGGFPKDALRKQLIGGWGREFAHQLFGTPRYRRRTGSR